MTSFCLGWSGKIGGAGLGNEVEVEADEVAGRGGDVDGGVDGEVAIIRYSNQTTAVVGC